MKDKNFYMLLFIMIILLLLFEGVLGGSINAAWIAVSGNVLQAICGEVVMVDGRETKYCRHWMRGGLMGHVKIVVWVKC